jgi:membrane-bound metal-dependent hydrolase YbcI (DUF457 family)
LPLVGGGEHDWAYLLGALHWLPYDQRIARGLWTTGVVIYVAAIIGGLWAVTGTTAAAPLSFAEPTAPREE